MTRFTAIEEAHLGLLKELRNNNAVRPYVREHRMLNNIDQATWYQGYCKTRNLADWGQELMIIDDKSVGGFVRIQWRNQRAELSYYTLEENEHIITRQLKDLVNKGFMEFGFNKITWPVYEHHPLLPLFLKIFNEEAVLKEEYLWNGRLLNRHYLSITKKEFDKSS